MKNISHEKSISVYVGFQFLAESRIIFLASTYYEFWINLFKIAQKVEYYPRKHIWFGKESAAEFCQYLREYLNQESLNDFSFLLDSDRFTIKFFRTGAGQPMIRIMSLKSQFNNVELVHLLEKTSAEEFGLTLNYEMLQPFINELEKFSKTI